jgi:hypothetical protein
MRRIKHLLLIAFLFVCGSAHAINNYQDWWWNPTQSGMGLNVGQQNDSKPKAFNLSTLICSQNQ